MTPPMATAVAGTIAMNHLMRRLNIIVLILLFWTGAAIVPNLALARASRPTGPGYWRHYNTSNSELLSNTIQALVYTEDIALGETVPGLWIGTDKGLDYTDGRDWQAYTAASSDLPSDDVRAIVPGVNPGELWIATAAGVARLNYAGTPLDRGDDTWKVFTAADGPPQGVVLCLALGSNGEVWAGTTMGLLHYDGRGWLALRQTNATVIHDLTYDATAQLLWAATDQGVGQLDTRTGAWTLFRHQDPDSSLPSDDVRALVRDAAGRFWIGTSAGLAVRFADGTWQNWATRRPGPPHFPITDLALDPSARFLWVATEGGGAGRYDLQAESWQRFDLEQSELPDARVRVVLPSHDGITWFGTAAGLSGMEQSWIHVPLPAPRPPGLLAGNEVWAGWLDPSTGSLWVATSSGLSRGDPGGDDWQTYTTAQGLGADEVRSIWGDGQGTVWVGTWGGGVSRSTDDGASWQTFTTTQGLGGNQVRAVWGDGTGTLWVGTEYGGVSRTTDNGQNWQVFTTTHGLGSNEVRTIWGDQAGTVWVGTWGQGISRSTDGGAHWEVLPVGADLWSNTIRSGWLDRAGVLWVGTLHGVGRSTDRGRSWRFSTTANGLGDNYVWSVWGDDNGAVWAGTWRDGVSRSTDGGVSWQSMTRNDGLPADEIRAIWGNGTGTVWVGSWGGGIGRSQDEGATWRVSTYGGLPSNKVAGVWGVPGTDTVWIATDLGVSHSTDGGKSWRSFVPNPRYLEHFFSAVWTAPDGTVWASGAGGFYYSTDNGQHWQTIPPGQGGGSAYFTAVSVTRDGTMWVGVWNEGVYRSTDGGDHWRKFGVPPNEIRAVWADGADTVWVGLSCEYTRPCNGLQRSTDGGTSWQAFGPSEGLAGNAVGAIWGDGAGSVWVGTWNGGVSRSTDGGGHWQTFTTANGLGSNEIRALWGDGAGMLWAGTTYGISRSTDGGQSWRTATISQGLPNNGIRSIWSDNAGTVWVSTRGGVSRSTDDGQSWQSFTVEQDQGAKNVQAVWDDGAGTVWVGTLGGLDRSTDGGASWRRITTDEGLAANAISAVWGDGAGAVWVGTGQGLCRSTDGGDSWQTWTTAQGLAGDNVRAVWGDGSGAVWVGTVGGVSRSTDGGKSWQTFTSAQGLGVDWVESGYSDRAGTIWLGTWGGGLSYSSDGGQIWQRVVAPDLSSNNITAVWSDGAGVVWAGTAERGPSRSTDGGRTWKRYWDEPCRGPGSWPISVIGGNARGMVCKGSAEGGLACSTDDGESWQYFYTANGLPSSNVSALWMGSDGPVWVGTDLGLARVATGPAPRVSWREPAEFAQDRPLVLLDAPFFQGKVAGVSLAPAGAPDQLQYTLVLSPLAGGPAFQSTAKEENGVATLALGSEMNHLPYGKYDLALIVTDKAGRSVISRRTLDLQARPVISGVSLYRAERILYPVPTATPVPPSPSSIPTPRPSRPTPAPALPSPPVYPLATPTGLSYVPPPTAIPCPTRQPVVLEPAVLEIGPGTEPITLTAVVDLVDPDSPAESVALTYAWDPGTAPDWRLLQGNVVTANGLISGSHLLAFRATDADGNTSLEPFEVPLRVVWLPLKRPVWPWLIAGILAASAALGLAFLLKRRRVARRTGG